LGQSPESIVAQGFRLSHHTFSSWDSRWDVGYKTPPAICNVQKKQIGVWQIANKSHLQRANVRQMQIQIRQTANVHFMQIQIRPCSQGHAASAHAANSPCSHAASAHAAMQPQPMQPTYQHASITGNRRVFRILQTCKPLRHGLATARRPLPASVIKRSTCCLPRSTTQQTAAGKQGQQHPAAGAIPDQQKQAIYPTGKAPGSLQRSKYTRGRRASMIGKILGLYDHHPFSPNF